MQILSFSNGDIRRTRRPAPFPLRIPGSYVTMTSLLRHAFSLRQTTSGTSRRFPFFHLVRDRYSEDPKWLLDEMGRGGE